MFAAPKDKSFDYYQLSRDVVKTLRGDLTQRHLSKTLDYSFNQVGKWESGVTQVKWVDFIAIAKALSIPIDHCLKQFFGNYDGTFTAPDIFLYLDGFLGLQSIRDGYSKRLVKRWHTHKTSPDLAEIFRVFDSRPAMLLGFLSYFVDCATLDSTCHQYVDFKKELALLYEDPNIAYVNEALKVRAYTELEYHDEQLLARHASCTIEALKKTLHSQSKLGTLFFDGKKYIPSPLSFSFSSLNNQYIRKFNKYTFDLVAEKYPIVRPDDRPGDIINASLSSNRVVAMSREASLKVNVLVSKLHNEIGEIIKTDNCVKENVQIISVASVVTAIKA